MPTARGRDGPAKGGCRGSRIGAPSPAPGDQPPKGPETAYLYVRPSGRIRQLPPMMSVDLAPLPLQAARAVAAQVPEKPMADPAGGGPAHFAVS